MSNPVRPHRWQPTRLLCPWDSPGKNTGEGCHFLFPKSSQCLNFFFPYQIYGGNMDIIAVVKQWRSALIYFYIKKFYYEIRTQSENGSSIRQREAHSLELVPAVTETLVRPTQMKSCHLRENVLGRQCHRNMFSTSGSCVSTSSHSS